MATKMPTHEARVLMIDTNVNALIQLNDEVIINPHDFSDVAPQFAVAVDDDYQITDSLRPYLVSGQAEIDYIEVY